MRSFFCWQEGSRAPGLLRIEPCPQVFTAGTSAARWAMLCDLFFLCLYFFAPGYIPFFKNAWVHRLRWALTTGIVAARRRLHSQQCTFLKYTNEI